MTKENLSEGVILYHGDALGILYSLPDLVMDAVLTDPPYSSGGVTLGARQADPAHKYQQSGTKRQYPPMLGDTKDQRSWTMWCTLWLTECWRIARDGAPLLVFTDWRQLPSLSDAVQAAGWKWLGIVPWDKRSAPADRQIQAAMRVSPVRRQGAFRRPYEGLSAGRVRPPCDILAKGSSDQQTRRPD